MKKFLAFFTVAALLCTAIAVLPLGASAEVVGNVADEIGTGLTNGTVETYNGEELVKFTAGDANGHLRWNIADVVGYDYIKIRFVNASENDLSLAGNMYANTVLASNFVFLNKDGNIIGTHGHYDGGKIPAGFDGYILLCLTKATCQGGAPYNRDKDSDTAIDHPWTGHYPEGTKIDPKNAGSHALIFASPSGKTSTVYVGKAELFRVPAADTSKDPLESLNITIVDRLDGATEQGVTTQYSSPADKAPTAQILKDGFEGSAKFTWTGNATGVVMFKSLTAGVADYTIGGTVTPYGVAMYIKTGDKDVDFTMLRLDGVHANCSTNNAFYDMEGHLIAEGTNVANEGLIIPANSEGYIVCRFPAAFNFAACNEFTFWVNAVEGATIIVDNIGVVTAAPVAVPVTTAPPVVTTPAPEGTTPPTGNPNTGDITVILAAMTAISGAGAVLFARKKND